MAVQNLPVSGQFSVTTTPQQLPAHGTISGVLINNLSTDSISIFVGPAGVTATTGIEVVKSNPPVLIPVTDSSVLWVVTASSTATLTYMVV